MLPSAIHSFATLLTAVDETTLRWHMPFAFALSLLKKMAVCDTEAMMISALLLADLTSIGGLETLMGLLRDPHPSLRWHAAEVAATCVQNNPPVQEWFLKAGALPKFARLLADETATCR